MANERIIHTHEPYREAGEHQHVSQASHRRRREEIDNMVWEWRTEQVEQAERRYGEVIGDQLVPYDYHETEVFRSYE